MVNRLSIFFIISCISLNLSIKCCSMKLKNIPEIAESYEQAKGNLDSFLPNTFMSKRHKRNYDLLKKLDTQTKEILDYKSSKPCDEKFKELLIEYVFNNTVASGFCETEYAMMSNLHDENNPYIDGNDFNIMYTYKAYKKCVREILIYTEMEE
jgi:hypothetical protein